MDSSERTRKMRALEVVEETALMFSHVTTGEERARYKAQAQAAYDARLDLALNELAPPAEGMDNTTQGVRQ